jgi:hypothetical protein
MPTKLTGNAPNIGDRVHRTKECQDRLGTVIEIDGQRCRVLWDAIEPEPGTTASNYHAAKRTWVSSFYLASAETD